VTIYDDTLTIVAKLQAAGVNATDDPRGATPPCVLVVPPDLDFVLNCGALATWHAWALVPNPANRDAYKALADLVAEVVGVLPVERARLRSYVLANDAPALPAYDLEFEMGVEL
jgi:hypothetical protein